MEILTEILIIVFYLLSINQFSKINISNQTKLFTIFIIFLQFSSLLFFYPWFSRLISLFIVLISLYFIIKILRLIKKWDYANYTEYSTKIRLIQQTKKISKIVGFFIIILTLMVEIILLDHSDLSLYGKLSILAGTTWLFYTYIPEKYNLERDFTLLFINILAVLFTFPYLVYRILFTENNYQLYLTENLLVTPVQNILNLLGYKVWSNGMNIYFENIDAGIVSSVSIAAECSGIYSTTIFVSAFLSYSLNSSTRANTYMFVIIGIIMAYFSNILRMVAIVIVGHYYGLETLKWFHTNIGWLIFIIFLILFWNLFHYIQEYGKEARIN